MKKKRIIIIIAVIAVIAAVIGTITGVKVSTKNRYANLVYSVIRVEAGVSVDVTDFVSEQLAELSFTDKYPAFDTRVPGEYPVEIQHGKYKNESKLIVSDTIAPEATVRTISLQMGETCDADVFVESYSDVTPVTISYAKQPDFTKPGMQPVVIVISDIAGNTVSYSTGLFITAMKQSEITIEVGDPVPSVYAYVDEAAVVTTDFDFTAVDTNVVGKHRFIVNADGKGYECSLVIADRVAPDLEVVDLEGYLYTDWTVDEFITLLEDASAVKTGFRNEPDNTVEGVQELVIYAEDESGNVTEKTAKLTLAVDTQAPSITGVVDRRFSVGDSITYMTGVEITDNCEKGLTYEVDYSQVNVKAEGKYTVIYTATDAAGNTTVKTAVFTLILDPYSDYYINELVTEVYNKIIKEGMDDLQRLRAIYDYVHKHVNYSGYLGLGHENRNKAIYYAQVKCLGDCYGYAMLAQALLDMGGFKAITIEKVKLDPSMSTHFWELVDLGDGYYHFDTCIRKDRPEIFMWNDLLMMLYSDKHNYCHNYDTSLYTVNKTGDIYAFMYGNDYKRPKFVYGAGLDNYFANGGSISKYYGIDYQVTQYDEPYVNKVPNNTENTTEDNQTDNTNNTGNTTPEETTPVDGGDVTTPENPNTEDNDNQGNTGNNDNTGDVTNPDEENQGTEATEPDDDNQGTESTEPDDDNQGTESTEPDDDNRGTESTEPDDDNPGTEATEPDDDNQGTEATEPDDDNQGTESTEPDDDNHGEEGGTPGTDGNPADNGNTDSNGNSDNTGNNGESNQDNADAGEVTVPSDGSDAENTNAGNN